MDLVDPNTCLQKKQKKERDFLNQTKKRKKKKVKFLDGYSVKPPLKENPSPTETGASMR